MGFKEVESSFATPWSPEKKGEQLIGTYAGSEEVPAGRGTGELFTSWRFRNSEGRYIGISGAMLKSKMNQIAEGTIVRVTFKGKFKTTNGLAKDYLIEVDERVELLDPFATPAESLGDNTHDANRATA